LVILNLVNFFSATLILTVKSVKQFQRRSYAKLRWFHSGKKGYGLQLQEDVTDGRFLIEYVGEVLLSSVISRVCVLVHNLLLC